MVTFKTKDGTQTGFVPGVGEIVNGLLKNAPDNLESANLEKVQEQEMLAQPAVPAAPVPSPSIAAALVSPPAASNPSLTAQPAQPNQETN